MPPLVEKVQVELPPDVAAFMAGAGLAPGVRVESILPAGTGGTVSGGPSVDCGLRLARADS